MKFTIENKTKENPFTLLRDLGYFFMQKNQHTGELTFIRALGQNFYPRFHLYAQEKDGLLYLKLHLDQKKPSYPGAKAHSGEHEGPVIEKEANRIRQGLS